MDRTEMERRLDNMHEWITEVVIPCVQGRMKMWQFMLRCVDFKERCTEEQYSRYVGVLFDAIRAAQI